MKKISFLFAWALMQVSLLRFPATLNAQNWVPVGSGTNWSVSSLYNDTVADLLYVGGYFTTAGGVPANRIATYDGTTWNALGSGVNNFPVWCIAKYNGYIYAGGTFDSAGNVKAKNIAAWDGTNWFKLLGGTNGWVKTMAVYNNELYVGGIFSSVDNGAVTGSIVKWNGSSWFALGTGVNAGVTALQVYNGKLYVGGGFTIAGGQPAYYIAAWDGFNWSVVGNGLAASVSSMAVSNGSLFINYDTNVAIWDGIFLNAMSGSIADNNALCLLATGTDLYRGGHFTMIGGSYINRIANWNQQSWTPLGSGIGTGGVFSMAIYHNELYAGGWFDSAGSNPIQYIAKWDLATSKDEYAAIKIGVLEISPNPFRENTSFYFRSAEAGPVTLKIFSASGQLLKILFKEEMNASKKIKISFNERDLPQGIYYAILQNREGVQSKKIVKLK